MNLFNRGTFPINNPCFGCRTRTAECHSTCKEYKNYQQKYKAYTDNVKNGKNIQLFGYVHDVCKNVY